MSSEKNNQGSLFDEIVTLSGLNKATVLKELEDIAVSQGKQLEDLTLDEMRAVMAQYVRKTFLEVSQESSEEDSMAT